MRFGTRCGTAPRPATGSKAMPERLTESDGARPEPLGEGGRPPNGQALIRLSRSHAAAAARACGPA
jgi:hypothetical protein